MTRTRSYFYLTHSFLILPPPPTQVYLNSIPEEAERGEFYVCELEPGTAGAEPRQLTEGAGRVDRATLSPDGNHVIYKANRSQDRPITTHMDLWVCSFDHTPSESSSSSSKVPYARRSTGDAGEEESRGGDICAFGWVSGSLGSLGGASSASAATSALAADGGRWHLYVSSVMGATRNTKVYRVCRRGADQEEGGGEGKAEATGEEEDFVDLDHINSAGVPTELGVCASTPLSFIGGGSGGSMDTLLAYGKK